MFENLNLEIKKSNLYETIADKLEEMVLNDTLRCGDKLPAEQTLADSFGVSRNIIREALKMLKERGLLELKTGEGAYIAKPKSKMLTDMVNRMMVMGGISYENVYEMRFALEVYACGLAAEKAEELDVTELEKIVEDMENSNNDAIKWAENDLRFHIKIAQMTGNPLFKSIIKSLDNVLITVFVEGFDIPGAVYQGVTKHTKIIEAVRNKDRDAAEKAMYEHLKRSEDDLLKLSSIRKDTK